MPVFQSNGSFSEVAVSGDLEWVEPGAPIEYPFIGARRGYDLPPVRTVVDFIARHVSGMPLKVFRRDGEARERVRDGDLAELVREPWSSPLPTRRFWYSLIADGLLTDRMLAVYDQTSHELRRIPPQRWKVRKGDFDQLVGVRVYGEQGDFTDLDVGDESMILDVGYAFSGATGAAQTQTLRRILDEYRESVEYRASVNKKSARMPFVVTRDRAWDSEESRNRFNRGFQAFVSGGASAGSGFLLEDGMGVESLNMFKPIDVGDLDARDRVKVDVANAYGIPAEIMGLRPGNFSNLEAYRQMLYGTYLRPYIGAFEESINRGLAAFARPGEYVECDLDAQMRGNPEAQYAAMSTATGRPFMTTNEIRARMNLPPVDGGDDLVTPLNVLTGGQTSPQDGQTGGRGGGSLTDAEGGA